MKRLLGGLSVALLLATAAFAQTTDETPRLTEVEALRLQVASLQSQVMALNMTLEGCRVEVAHPGYKFDPSKGLVKK